MTEPATYRHEDGEVRALRWMGVDAKAGVCKFMGGCDCDADCAGEEAIVVDNSEAETLCEVGDWVVRDARGEFYPVKPDEFNESYEPVESS